MIIHFTDTEKNDTYLSTNKGLSHTEIIDLCNAHYKKAEGREDVDPLTVLEWAIRKQLVTLLTDEEVEQLLEKQSVANKG